MIKQNSRSNQSKINLQQAGLKKTLPRELILDILENNPQRHFRAEELYQILLERGNSVSVSTVYRVLAQFEIAGLVIRHQFEGTTSFFELSRHGHHDHIVCVNCGKIIEFNNDDIERLQREVSEKHGFSLVTHTLCMFGTCQDSAACLNKFK